MRHIPYGYRIRNGKAVIDPVEAKSLVALFENYLDGMGMLPAARAAGIEKIMQTGIARMLQNRHYLGDDFYPAIIDQELFDITEEERIRRSYKLGRVHEYEDVEGAEKVFPKYRLDNVPVKYDDPYAQAAYIYSMIESEEA